MDVAPISVVIPAHNEERFIGDAIRSVLTQTLPVSEVIVIADDCTDGTKQIACELGVTVLEQKRRNMAAALNLGIGAGTQPWVAFLDADDFWDREKIALQWQAIETCPDAGLIACDSYSLVENEVVDFDRKLSQRWAGLPHRISTRSCQYLSKVEGEFLGRFYLQTSRVVVKREAVSEVGLLNESFTFWQTIEFFSRVLCRYPIAFVERPLVYQRLHRANHTRNIDGYWTAYFSMIAEMLRNPDRYPPGSGDVYRQCLKRDFHHTERELARAKGSA
jgi:glycosyltransferase involved in cell wall biosynthesis